MTSPAVARLVRAAAAAVCAALLLPGAAPAHAAGTGGIEVTPVPGVVDGRQVTSFRVELPGDDEEREVPFALRNITDGSRTARLYAAAATRQRDGTYTVAGPGSTPHVRLPDESVTLRAGALEQRTFTITGTVERQQYAAVVLEVRNGSVVQRAATLVTLDPPDELPVPLLLGLGAAAVVVAVGTGVVLVARRRRAEGEPDPTG